MKVDEPDPQGRVRIVQRPVYYISEVIHDTKTRYLKVHKLHYAVLIASRNLLHYIQAHKILVVTSYPLRALLHNPNATGNITKWAVELAEFELDFIVSHAIKSQVLTDFVVDWTPPPSHRGGGGRMAVCWSRELRFSPALTGFSSLTTPHISRGPAWEPCSLLHTGNNSSIWCILSLKRPTTWQNMRP
jgi:hypothetical protein